MDAKITKQRLSRMLSYDWLKIVGIIVAICIVWSLVFTMTATQITPTQKFHVYNYVGNSAFSDKFNNLYNQAFREEFSYEILELGSENLGEEVNTILEARFAVGEGDLMFIAHAKNEKDSYKLEGDENVYYYNYTETFARGRFRNLYALEGENNYFTQYETYLSKYYVDGNWKTGALDEEKVKADFRERVEKDKRFKTETQLLQGEKDDIARIESYRDALAEFYVYLNDMKIVRFETVTVNFSETESKEFTCYLNLNPTTPVLDEAGKVKTDEYGNVISKETAAGLTDYLSYYETIMNEKGEVEKSRTSKNMCVGFLTMDHLKEKYRTEEGFQCEDLLFVNMLIRAANNIEKADDIEK